MASVGNNHGISIQRNGFDSFIGSSSIQGWGDSTTPLGVVTASSGLTIGVLSVLRDDLTHPWTMYAGNPYTNVPELDDDSAVQTKQYFVEIGTNKYSGVANYPSTVPSGKFKEQHVLLVETTENMLPGGTTNLQGIDQRYRIRFEWDERRRLFPDRDKEYNYELYQMNLRLSSMGYNTYTTNNGIIDETSLEFKNLFPWIIEDLPGHATNVDTNFTDEIGNYAWDTEFGIPNRNYGWLKINVGTKYQLNNDYTISENETTGSGILLDNGNTLETSLLRYPGECVDIKFEELVIRSRFETGTFTYVTGADTYDLPSYPTDTALQEIIIKVNSVIVSSENYTLDLNNKQITFVNNYTLEDQQTVDVYYSKYTSLNDVRFRNKLKGSGWFKRAGKNLDDVTGTYPMNYRLTMTDRGIAFYLYDNASVDQDDDYAWICVQRTVDNTTGKSRLSSDVASRFPVHCLYSTSRESTLPKEFGIYYSTNDLNLLTPIGTLQTVYDSGGNSYTLNEISTGNPVYVVSQSDREDYLSEEFLAKKIWRFVVREQDVLKPWEVHRSATRHETRSNAIINPLEQLGITDDNKFIITFPTGLTTQRFMYPKEEIDMICFSSSEVVAFGSNVEMQTYIDTGIVDSRRYQGMLSTMPFGNGMRILMLVQGNYIYSSDINI